MISDAIRSPASSAALDVTRSRSLAPELGATLAWLALAATFLAVVAMFAISPILLESRGIAYLDSGGGILSKVHPATFMALIALLMRCLASARPMRLAWRLPTSDGGVLLLLAATTIAAAFAVLVDKTPVTPLIDTLVLPVLVFLLLRDLDPAKTRLLATLVTFVLVANAALALYEFAHNWHLIQVPVPAGATDDPTKANGVFSWTVEQSQDWRAEALLGHPLVNGLIVGGFVLCLLSPAAAWIPTFWRLPLIAIESASMLAFGVRSPLVLLALLGGWLIASRVATAIGRGVRPSPGQLAGALVGLALFTLLAVIVVQSGFADKTIDRFTNDAGSARTRLTMFSLFAPMTLTDLVLHPDKDLVATLQRINGLEFGIESSWIGLVLTYGLVVAGIIAAGLLAFMRSLARVSGRGAALALFYYLVLVSVTASLSGKTTTLAMEVAVLMLFLGRVDTVRTRRARTNDRPAHSAEVER